MRKADSLSGGFQGLGSYLQASHSPVLTLRLVTWSEALWVGRAPRIWGVGRRQGGLLGAPFQDASVQLPILHSDAVLFD